MLSFYLKRLRKEETRVTVMDLSSRSQSFPMKCSCSCRCFPAGLYLVHPGRMIGSLPQWISQSPTSFWMETGACLTPPLTASAALLNGQWCYLTVHLERAVSLHHRLDSDSRTCVSWRCSWWISLCGNLWIYKIDHVQHWRCQYPSEVCWARNWTAAYSRATVPGWMCSFLIFILFLGEMHTFTDCVSRRDNLQ